MESLDVAIIGGGIVGLATAYELTSRYPHLSIVVIEKEDELATHQTGHNSGVMHSGIYYKPGSLKARNCRDGKMAMQRFCEEQGIPFEICGKVIVATERSEIPGLEKILERGRENGVRCEMIDQARLLELEPHVAGVQAIHVPEAGIVNYRQVAQRMADIVRQRGGSIECGQRVNQIRTGSNEIYVGTPEKQWKVRHLVNCAGLQSDRVTELSGCDMPAKIVPFRGEYYKLKPEARHLCRNLIYPVPDPRFPFLGVHFTRMIDGSVECGPNAVLAMAREGYQKTNVNPRDLWDAVSYTGFLRLAGRYWQMGMAEMWRSLSKGAFVAALQRLIPDIRGDLILAAPSGVRAQAVAPDGTIIDDFLIVRSDRVVNVCNAPSPAATSSLNIAKHVVQQLQIASN